MYIENIHRSSERARKGHNQNSVSFASTTKDHGHQDYHIYFWPANCTPELQPGSIPFLHVLFKMNALTASDMSKILVIIIMVAKWMHGWQKILSPLICRGDWVQGQAWIGADGRNKKNKKIGMIAIIKQFDSMDNISLRWEKQLSSKISTFWKLSELAR